MVAEQVTVRWVMEAHRSMAAAGARQEDIVQLTMAEAGSEASIVPATTEPNIVLTVAEPRVVVPTIAELPSYLLAVPSANMTRGPQ